MRLGADTAVSLDRGGDVQSRLFGVWESCLPLGGGRVRVGAWGRHVVGGDERCEGGEVCGRTDGL